MEKMEKLWLRKFFFQIRCGCQRKVCAVDWVYYIHDHKFFKRCSIYQWSGNPHELPTLSISCTKRCEKNVGKSYGQLVQVKSAFENQCPILAKPFHLANVCPLSASCRTARTALFPGLNFAMSGSTPAMDCSVFFHVVPCSVISSKVSSE